MKHHIVPQALFKEAGAVGDALRATGFDMHAGDNIRHLESAFHGSHPAYTKYVTDKFTTILQGNGNNLTVGHVNQVINEMQGVINQAEHAFKSSGGNLNSFFK